MTGTAPKALRKGAEQGRGTPTPTAPMGDAWGWGARRPRRGNHSTQGWCSGGPRAPSPRGWGWRVLGTQHPQHGEGCARSAHRRWAGGQGHHGVTEPSTQGGGLVGWGSAPPGKPPPSSPCVTPAGLGSFTETSRGEGKPRHGGTRAPAGRGGSLQGAAPSRKEKGVKKHPTDAFATIPQPHGLVPVLPPLLPLVVLGKKN